MKFAITLTALLVAGSSLLAADTSTPTEQSFDAPHGLKVSVKMIGPYSQSADLQIVCAFQHKAGGDTYIGAMKDLDDKLGGLLSSLRNRGEFAGALGETILLTPPKGSIVAQRLLVIGLGEEKDLSLDTLKLIGRIAAREAVALQAKHVAFAPVIRDQGNNTIDVGAGDRNFIENVILAYDTEKRLQAQSLAPAFQIEDLTIEAGPTYFADASKQVQSGIGDASAQIAKRSDAPYSTVK